MSSENDKKDFKLTEDQISNFDIGEYAKGDFNLAGIKPESKAEPAPETKKAQVEPKKAKAEAKPAKVETKIDESPKEEAPKEAKEKKEFKLPKIQLGSSKADKKAPKEKAPKGKKEFSYIYSPETGKGLALRIVLALAIPYAYLMLCGLVFDRWLHLYNMTTFIFFSYVILALAGLVEIVLSIIKYVKRKR